MLWHIAWFEIRFWLRSWMLWIFLFVVGLLIFGAISSDEVMADFNLSNIYRNAPFAIASFYAAMGVLTLLMTAVFVNFAALRDFSYNTYQMTFSLPIRCLLYTSSSGPPQLIETMDGFNFASCTAVETASMNPWSVLGAK